jgi:hypothetical protein
VEDTRLPDFKPPAGLGLLSRCGTDGYRIEQMKEIEAIKERLARDHCPQNVVTLQRAVLIPEDCQYVPGQRKYPSTMSQLMANPFPKKKKKGKKKGKKSKK